MGIRSIIFRQGTGGGSPPAGTSAGVADVVNGNGVAQLVTPAPLDADGNANPETPLPVESESLEAAIQAAIESVRGQYDDNSPEGALKVRSSVSDFVFVPWRDGAWEALGSGSSTTLYNPGAVSGGEAAPGGPGGVFYTNVSADALENTTGRRTTFRGPVFGLARRNQPPPGGSAQPSITSVIDGIPYEEGRGAVYFDGEAQTATAGTESYTSTLLIDDLPDIEHTVSVLVTSDANIYRLIDYGFFGDARQYMVEDFPKIATLASVDVPWSGSAALAVPSQPAAVSSPSVAAQADRKFRYLREILFYNTDSVDHKVNIFRDGTVMLAINVPTGGSASWDPKAYIGLAGYSFRAQAAAPTTGSTKVTATVTGRP